MTEVQNNCTNEQVNGTDEPKEYCFYCGVVDREYDENSIAIHNVGPKHICNQILYEYHEQKKSFTKNRDNIQVFISAKIQMADKTFIPVIDKTDQSKIRIAVKPMQIVEFFFEISNISKKETKELLGVQLGHPQSQFELNGHLCTSDANPRKIEMKSTIKDNISVKFQSMDIGQYEMPIMFTFQKTDVNADDSAKEKYTLIIREMIIKVEENPVQHKPMKSPYTKYELETAKRIIHSLAHRPPESYKIPKLLKVLLPRGLREDTLEKLAKHFPYEIDNLRNLFNYLCDMFRDGVNKDNYVQYFQHLLWWEECVAKINIKKYNMSGVTLRKFGDEYVLVVPGLAEKRPSLLRGDSVYLQPQDQIDIIFDSRITNISEDFAHLGSIDKSFDIGYRPEALFDVRFIMSRVPLVRCHEALHRLQISENYTRIFPEPVKHEIPCKAIKKFYNKYIAHNEKQKEAVEHIVSGTSGLAPYIVFGPPGTGKTVTIVEAIIQLVVSDSRNRVMVCTDSNMAADHIALTLLKYQNVLNIKHFLLRANSQTREWTSMPSELAGVSNGTCYKSFVKIDNVTAAKYRVFVTTLLHAAKYASNISQSRYKLSVSHLFIDEASQGSEPAVLIPVTGLLAPSGRLILAGDPKQLGPVCVSRQAGKLGLGMSLLERLYKDYENLYDNNSMYITTLVNNFRSHSDILQIPNKLFYENQLQPLAPLDKLSEVSILGLPGGDRAIVFHSVNSSEQKSGNAPSFFNQMELEMVQRYVKALIENLNVLPEDIGVIAPYIRQVYKMRNWLTEKGYDKVEAGTVEAFQGKEKRVIIVSTVRANCKLLDYDAKYGLGFLVDDKRFNVTITRAKSKLVIIGNETCLKRDVKWRIYMDRCRQYNTYFGKENEQMNRNSCLLREVAQIRFAKCRLTDLLKDKNNKKKKKRN